MPAITDPALLAQIKQQQLPQVTPQPFPGARVLGPMVNPARDAALAHSSTVDSTDVATAPARIREANAHATTAEIAAKTEQEKWDLAHPKPDALTGAYGPAALEGLDEGDKDVVKGLVTGRTQPPSNYAMKLPYWQDLIKRANQLDPSFDMTVFPRRKAAFNSFMAGADGRAIDRANQALQHLEIFTDAAKGMDNYHSGMLSTPLNAARVGTMDWEKDPRIAEFRTARDAVSTELAAAFKGGNDPALASVEHWQKVLGAASSPEQFDEIAKTAVGLLGGRIDAMNFRFKQAVGVNGDLYSLMTPKAKRIYAQYTGDNIDGDGQLSTTSKTVPIPQGYQDDHLAYLHQHPPGHLTVQGYIDMRKQLDNRYANDIGSGHSEITPEDAEKFVKQYNQSDGKVEKIPGMQMPLSEMEHLHAAAAESGPGVAAASAANAASMGIGENLLSDEQKHLMHMSEDAHPGYALAGEVAGGVAGMAGIQGLGIKGLEKLGPEALDKLGVKLVTNDAGKTIVVASAKKKLAGDIAVNSGYGAGRGFNDADQGQGLTAAAEGAVAGAVGAGVGNVVAKGVNPLISEGTSKALSQLKGVKTTTLQRLGLGSSEEAFSGVPGAHGARAESISSFNRDNASRALGYMKSPLLAGVDKTIPKSVATGTELNSTVNDVLSKGYNIIRPQIVGAVDGTFVKNMKTLVAAGTVTPAKKAMFQEIKDAVQQFADPVTGHYNGDGYKAASERLRALTQDFSTAAENNGDVGARDMARIAEQARKQLQMLIQRQTPEVGVALKQLERGWAHKMRIEDASNRALQNNETGYSPGQYLTSVKKLDTSGNKTAYARGKAFDQPYGEAAGKIIGFGPAKKISPKEILYASSLMGLGAWEAPVSIPIVTGMAAGLYGPGIKRIVQKALTGQRPSAIDNQIVRRALADATRHRMTGN